MMVGLLLFANAWRAGLLPKGYDFVHEFGKSLARTDRKPVRNNQPGRRTRRSRRRKR